MHFQLNGKLSKLHSTSKVFEHAKHQLDIWPELLEMFRNVCGLVQATDQEFKIIMWEYSLRQHSLREVVSAHKGEVYGIPASRNEK